MNYYNEFDQAAAEALRNMINEGVIPQGVVDDRSITDVEPGDLAGFTQCHFFAGGGGWSIAARLAGWPDDREIWTGSPPCQPFSVAGKGKAQADDRHLWPHLSRLIRARRPAVFMGEQVAAAVGRDWFCGVRADLEASGYASRGVIIPACAVNAPHRRDRLWIVAHAGSEGLEGRGGAERGQFGQDGQAIARGVRSGRSVIVAHADGRGSTPRIPAPSGRYEGIPGEPDYRSGEQHRPTGRPADCGAVADADGDRHNRSHGDAAQQGGNRAGDGLPVGVGGQLCGASTVEHADGGRYGDPNEALRAGRQGAVTDGERNGAVADADGQPFGQGDQDAGRGAQGSGTGEVAGLGGADGRAVADADVTEPSQGRVQRGGQQRGSGGDTGARDGGPVADADGSGREARDGDDSTAGHWDPAAAASSADHWSEHGWVIGHDGKARRVKPGVRLLVNGVAGGVPLVRTTAAGEEETHTYSRTQALKILGNAIVPQIAALMMESYLEQYP